MRLKLLSNSCFDLSSGTESFELVAVATNSDGDAWTNTSGSYNVGIGALALKANTTGSNVAVGQA